MNPDFKNFAEYFRSLAKMQSPEIIRDELKNFQPQDIADGLQRIPTSEGLNIILRLDDHIAADVLVELPKETARHYFGQLPDDKLATYLTYLPEDDASELQEEIGLERFNRILETIPEKEALDIKILLSYPEGSVGRIMSKAYVRINPNSTFNDVLEDIRSKPEGEHETINILYVVSEDGHLVGVLSLWQMLRAKPKAIAKELMHTEVVSCTADMPKEDAARVLAKYEFSSLPILDHRGRMLGILTADDAYEILDQAGTEDVLKLGAVTGDAEAYLSLNVFQIAKRRIPWLLPLFAAGTLSTFVLQYYHKESELHNAIIYFIPLLIGTGGNSGSQVTTTITRALALGEIRLSDALLVLRREFSTAIIVGTILGILGYLYAAFFVNVNPNLAIVVGLALPCIVLWATAVGSILPIAAKKVGIDPAVMSAPFITTLVDATGILIYMELLIHFMR